MAEDHKNEPQKKSYVPLDYQNVRERRPSSGGAFFAALAIGTAASCSFYFGFVPHATGRLAEAVPIGFIVLISLKLLLGIGLARDWRYRAWGAGLLLSMGLVLLIGFANCGPILDWLSRR
jgi:hypothetical protein